MVVVAVAVGVAVVTEAELQQGVIELARLLGWRVAHFRPARTERGWVTPVEADGKGFPDLVLVRRRRLIFVELKGASGRLSGEQAAWFDALTSASPEVYVWRPADWSSGLIERSLR